MHVTFTLFAGERPCMGSRIATTAAVAAELLNMEKGVWVTDAQRRRINKRTRKFGYAEIEWERTH